MDAHGQLLDRHRRVMPGWIGLYYDEPIELVGGDGVRVHDGQGREYLDFFGGILTTMSGHGVPEVVEAIREQAGRILHTSTAYLIRPMVELAERIAELSTIPDAKVFFVSSGTEAVDAALLLATTVRRSNQILALRNSYHGRSFAAMGVTGNRGWSASSLSPVQVSYVHDGHKRRSPFGQLSDAEFLRTSADDLRDVIETTTAGDVACLIAEPIQGVGGFTVPPDGFFGALQEVLDEYGILYVSDEVQTGWGRTGENFWGFQAHGVRPDLLTFAKGLGNGLAIGGVVGRAEVIDSIQASSISTFGGNPLAARGALANLEHLLSNDLQRNALERGTEMLDRLRALEDEVASIAEVRGKGLMIGIELAAPGDGRPLPDVAGAVLERARELGLLIGRGGLHGNALRVAPPLCLTAEEAKEGVEILAQALREADTDAEVQR